MANEIRTKRDAGAFFTITLAGLTAGSARQSTLIQNNLNRPAALIFLQMQTGGTAPATGTVYELFLMRNERTTISYVTDGGGFNDAAITINNAQMLGTIVVNNSANAYFYGDFDTAPLGPLGEYWGIAVRNNTDQTVSATEANFKKGYAYYLPEIQ